MKGSLQINTRITAELRETLDLIERDTQLTDQQLVRSLLFAVCDHYRRIGKLSFPIQIKDDAVKNSVKRAS